MEKSASQRSHVSAAAYIKDLILLVKPNVLFMNALMTLGGFAIAPRSDLLLCLKAIVGTALAIASAGILNMYLERDTDGLMKRTADRPLPQKRVSPAVALTIGLICGIASMVVLYFTVNPLTALLAFAALFVYAGIYTPLKTVTPLALQIGAFAGAMPPLMGWTAATGKIELPGLALCAVLYIWQLPHVIAISIYRREDYEKAGIRTIVVVAGSERSALHAFIYTIFLMFVAALPVVIGMAGWAYLTLSIIAGLFFLRSAFICMRNSSGENARIMFFTSLFYLPSLIAGFAVDAIVKQFI